MDMLGFTPEEISTALGHKGVYRYIMVGAMIDTSLLSNESKLCDPGITAWYEACSLGQSHFTKCLKAWNAGQWTEGDCNREFRRKGQVLPKDNAEKGFRVTLDVDRLVLRGQVDLNIHDPVTADRMIEAVIEHLEQARMELRRCHGDGIDKSFSQSKEVFIVNPLTV
jgi:uncharacterized ubiquitin-like protein YukD